jgi:DNA-directed RNA polymerase specialized sigma24 family protein
MIKDARDSDPDSAKNLLFGIAKGAALLLVRENQRLAAGAVKLSSDIEAIRGPEALDRLLRAEAATERSLNRAIDRLDSLQRRRKGEAVPPPLSVRLSR